MLRALIALAFVAVIAPGGAARAARDLPPRAGMYPQQGGALPMLDSDIAVTVRGPLAEATITQTFQNDSDRVVEATYIFPLPPDAAVWAMNITVGTKTIRAAIEPRAKAVERYEAAVTAGIGAGLLEQERPDVFTQTVSAIPARGTVTVTLRYDTVARYSRGTWELALPLVVAPRYVPGTASGRPTTGSGRSPDTDRAPDASRVTPSSTPGGGGRTDVHVVFTDTVDDITSPTHELTAISGGRALADPQSDRDIVIRWRAAASQQAWVERSPVANEGGYAAVLVEAKPPARRKGELRLRLVLDRAATTRGDAEAVQRALVRGMLGALAPADRVAVSGSDTLAFAAPDATLRALDEAWRTPTGTFDLTQVLRGLSGSDGALVLVTDGLVADDRAVIAAAVKLGAPVHVIGIGSAPNRGLLTKLAFATAGTVRFATLGDDVAALAADVIADAAAPPDAVAVTWGTLGASAVVPAKLPRIGSGQALLVVARVAKVQAANARVRGDVLAFQQLTADPTPAGATTPRGPLARRWAKLALDDLLASRATDAQIAEHAVRHGLVSPATAMVAVGTDVVVEGGVKHTVSVPVSVPAGMQWQLVKKRTTVTTVTGGERTKQDERQPVAAGPSPGAGAAVDSVSPEADTDAEDAAPAAREPSVTRTAADEGVTTSDESITMSGLGSSRAYRLSLALGGGVTRTGAATCGTGVLALRLDLGRGRTVVGGELAGWLVGSNVQGSAFALVTRRGLGRYLELGLGGGVRITGDAIGPALAGVARALLPVPGFALYLRYDGARLDSTWLNAGTVGVEARW